MSTTTAAKPAPFQHHAEYTTLAEMEEAATLAGYSKVGNHFEKPPGDGTWWTRKMSYVQQGLVERTFLMYSHS